MVGGSRLSTRTRPGETEILVLGSGESEPASRDQTSRSLDYGVGRLRSPARGRTKWELSRWSPSALHVRPCIVSMYFSGVHSVQDIGIAQGANKDLSLIVTRHFARRGNSHCCLLILSISKKPSFPPFSSLQFHAINCQTSSHIPISISPRARMHHHNVLLKHPRISFQHLLVALLLKTYPIVKEYTSIAHNFSW